jgi:hypothetical protein
MLLEDVERRLAKLSEAEEMSDLDTPAGLRAHAARVRERATLIEWQARMETELRQEAGVPISQNPNIPK